MVEGQYCSGGVCGRWGKWGGGKDGAGVLVVAVAVGDVSRYCWDRGT